MTDPSRTKQELIEELSVLKKKIKKLEKSESQQKPTETELHKSEHKYRQLAEDMPALICTFLPDSTLTYVNKAYCELFQRRPDELVGQKFLHFLPDEATRENVQRQYMSLTPEKPVQTYEHEVIVADGTNQYHWHRWTDRAFFSDNGQISHFQSIGQDITERKLTEEALRESEGKYHSLYRHSALGIFHSTFEGRFTDVNPALARMLGYDSPEEAVSLITSISEQIYAEPPQRDAVVTKALEIGGFVSVENCYRRRDGAQWYGMLHMRIVQDQQGMPSHFEGFVEDITERKRAEEALENSEERYRTLIETTRDLIYTTDRKGFLTYINPTLEKTLGYASHEWNRKTLAQIVAPEYIDSVKDHFKRAMKGESIPVYETVLMRKDGTKLSVEFNVTTLYDSESKPEGRFGIGRDVTDRKRAEEKLAAESHQLAETNTALRVLLQRREVDQKEMERKITANIQKLVLPNLEKLRSLKLNALQATCLDIVDANLQQVISPFLQNLAARFADFTPREIEVANMIREGKTSKEIANIFNTSIGNVDFHRDNIRKKLGLSHKKSNLRTFLMKLSEK